MGYGRDYFRVGLQHGILGAGRIRPSSQGKADILMARNSDAAVFAFNVVPGSLN